MTLGFENSLTRTCDHPPYIGLEVLFFIVTLLMSTILPPSKELSTVFVKRGATLFFSAMKCLTPMKPATRKRRLHVYLQVWLQAE